MKDTPQHLKALQEIEKTGIPGPVEVLREEGLDGVRYVLLWDATGWHRDYSPPAWRNRATEEQKRKGWEMAVRIERIICTVLDEAHRRQVEETMETLPEGPEDFYKSHPDREPGSFGAALTWWVPPSPAAPVGNAADSRPLFSGLLLRLLAQINRRFLLRLAHPYREDNRPGVKGDDPSRLFEHHPALVHVPEQPYGPSPWGPFARVQGHLLTEPGF